MNHNDHDLSPELADVARRLRAECPDPSPLELDGLRRRVHGRGTGTARTRGNLMKSRLMITFTLALGGLLSTTGVGLAVTGIASSGSASSAQYHHDLGPRPHTDNTSGAQFDPSATLGDAQSGGGSDALGTSTSGAGPNDPNGPQAAVDEPEQLAATGGDGEANDNGGEANDNGGGGGDSGEELPFTGFLAVPALIGGVALLGTGLALRRHADDETVE